VSPAGHPGAVSEFLRQLLASDPGTKHEQDAGKRAAVIKPFPTGMVEASLPHRQQRLDPLPEFVVKQSCCHREPHGLKRAEALT
jgi:hypothetical protein